MYANSANETRTNGVFLHKVLVKPQLSDKNPTFAAANKPNMLFNSIQFAIFLPIVFLFYWFAFDRFISKSKHQLRLQNAFVVVASYVFYGWWDWRFFLEYRVIVQNVVLLHRQIK